MPPEDSERSRWLQAALRLSEISVAWGLLSGTASVAIGLRDGSLGVLGLGLNVLADVAGSAVLIWRFRAELAHAGHAERVERRAAVVVAAALGTVGVVLAGSAIHALAVGSRPGSSALAVLSATLAFAVLAPLARRKRSVGRALGSRALSGDGTISGIGAAVALLALAGLALSEGLGWWWADRVAALAVAGIAAAEAARAIRQD
jgi:divalent metal cation (Fe/Co/Zn/Cd) transporter